MEANEAENVLALFNSIPKEYRFRIFQIFGSDPMKWEWNRVKDFLSSENSMTPGEALRCLGQRKQKENESLDDYINELNNLVEQLGCINNGILLSVFFILGLRDEVTAARLRELWHKDLKASELLNAAKIYQNFS